MKIGRTLVGLSLATIPAFMKADIGSAFVKFDDDAILGLYSSSFPNANYTTSQIGTRGSGTLYSVALHGPIDNKNFPISPAYDESTVSNGDSEVSSSRVKYSATSGVNYFVSIDRGTFSDSQAATLGLGEHWSQSYTDTRVLQRFDVLRNTGVGIAPVSSWPGLFTATANAIHLKAEKTGSGEANCQVIISVVGNVKNLNLAGSTNEGLTEMDVVSKSIVANDEWFNPVIAENVELKLPDWTRLSGAHFELELGLRLRMLSHAKVNAVPEPTTIAGLGIGIVALLRRRKLNRTSL